VILAIKTEHRPNPVLTVTSPLSHRRTFCGYRAYPHFSMFPSRNNNNILDSS